jgi:hypothetical protein
VRAYDPTVLVVVARKPARLIEALDMGLAPGALVISDLAIPFSASVLDGARVAIVDDVVNVGSTILRAARRVSEAGAGDTQAFAISRLHREEQMVDLDVEYSEDQPLDPTSLGEFAARIPDALQSIPKPYDLEFPVLECDLQSPLTGYDDLLASLRQRHGESRVYDLTTVIGARQGIRRCAIDLNDAGPIHRKVRFYFDESTGRCNVMPIEIPPALIGTAPKKASAWSRGLWETLAPCVPDERDARCRLRLFVDSLSLGERFVGRNSESLRLDGSRPFAVEDAQLVLGPLVRRVEPVTEPEGPEPSTFSMAEPWPTDTGSGQSDFLPSAEAAGLMAAIRNRAAGRDPVSAFISCFEVLAEWVGASDPREYRLTWPYTYEDIERDPYLRLRVGPTLTDLVLIVGMVTGVDDFESTRRQVTRLLDRFIDGGGVVPTTAEYDSQIYRIYRKGETRLREHVSERTKYAWRSYGEPLSLTRASKLLAILAFDDAEHDSAVTVQAAPRGNTLSFAPSILDDTTEVTHYLRNTSQLKPAKRVAEKA